MAAVTFPVPGEMGPICFPLPLQQSADALLLMVGAHGSHSLWEGIRTENDRRW